MEITLSGSAFQISAAATGKARLPTVQSLKGWCQMSGESVDQIHRQHMLTNHNQSIQSINQSIIFLTWPKQQTAATRTTEWRIYVIDRRLNSQQVRLVVRSTSMTRVTMIDVFLKRSATPPRTGTMRSQRTLTVNSAMPYATINSTCQSSTQIVRHPDIKRVTQWQFYCLFPD